jgi:two-component system, cell cycle sensor histidine kinase and response regulator CckA
VPLPYPFNPRLAAAPENGAPPAGESAATAGQPDPATRRWSTESEQLHQALARLSAQLADTTRQFKTEQAARQQAESDRQRTEQRMMATQQLESLGALASGLAHQLNNLLTVIIGQTGLAAMIAPADPALETSFAEVQHAAQQAAILCQQILAHAGHNTANRVTVDPAAAVSDTLRLVRKAAGRQCRFEFRPAGHALPKVDADPHQLQQILANVALNAAEAIGENAGNVRGSVHCLELDAEAAALFKPAVTPGRYVCFEIADDGCGIPPENRARLFEPFFSTKFLGRGLGLAAALGLVRAHAGGIAIESHPGQGTTVRIVLPPATPATPSPAPVIHEAPPASETADWRGRGCLLLADDEESVRKMAAHAAATLGFEVVTARDGLEAMERFGELGSKLSAVVLDVNMPGLNGVDTGRRLRALRPDLPILLTSGYTERQLLEPLAQDLTVGFLPKPFSVEALKVHLRAAMRAVGR